MTFDDKLNFNTHIKYSSNKTTVPIKDDAPAKCKLKLLNLQKHQNALQ